jgi:hypothetical protein
MDSCASWNTERKQVRTARYLSKVSCQREGYFPRDIPLGEGTPWRVHWRQGG